MSGDGDGWVRCSAGHRHWGRYGAAGLLVSDGRRLVLQHRAPWTHEGDTWGLPGGARDSHEDPVATALREACEEAAIDASLIDPLALWVADHGGWSYTTVLARPRGEVTPSVANAESVDVRWWTHEEVDTLALHAGFASSWPHVRHRPPPLVLVVQARDLPAAGAAADQLSILARHGISASALPFGVSTGGLAVLLPRIVLVADDAPEPEPVRAGEGWWQAAVSVRPAFSAPRGTAQVIVVGEQVAASSAHRVSVDWLANLTNVIAQPD